MREDADEIVRKAYETLARLEARDRERGFEERRSPVDVVVVEPVADWRGCRATKEMSPQQFNAWCDAGKPKLGEIIPPASRVSRDVEHVRARVLSVENNLANLRSDADKLVDDLGAVTGVHERKLNALAAEVGKLQAERAERSADAVIELPHDWRAHAH